MFGDRNELGGRYQAADRMRPPRQRHHADELLAAGVDDRLIQHLEAVGLDSLAQLRLDQLALRQIGIHHGVVHAGAVAAFVLGPVQGHVGITHDVGGAALGASIDHGDADACADDDGVAVDQIGGAKRGNDALGDRLQDGGFGCPRGDDRELVAAKSGDEIVASHHARQS
jgi:hypothetical protein